MEFRNLTPFPALAFEGIDAHDEPFHVVVLRQTLSYASGTLDYADDQAPLCEAEAFHGAVNASSVREESDLCHYKPKCDILVEATARAPGGRAATSWGVRLQVRAPRPASDSLPQASALDARKEQSANRSPASQAQGEQRRAPPPDNVILLDKRLVVTGPRRLERDWLGRYRLSDPQAVLGVPLRDELAYGGRCRVALGDFAASRVPPEHRLSDAQRIEHPEAPQAPLADRLIAANPVGRGYAEDWYLAAARPERLEAPQIEHPDHRFTAERFAAIAAGKAPALPPQGLGVRPKNHPERVRLGGTIDADFQASARALPEDFDFAFWNGAWPDQQIEHLRGDETFLFANLALPGSAASVQDTEGNTVTRLTLPGHDCYLVITLGEGLLAAAPMVIDTVHLAPDACALSLVWRSVLAKRPDAPIARVEVRFRSRARKAREQAWERLTPEASATSLTRCILAEALGAGTRAAAHA